MKPVYISILLLISGLACTAQSMRLPAIHKGEEIRGTAGQSLQLKLLQLTKPSLNNTLISHTSLYLSEFCISHDPFSFVTVEAARKDDYSIELKFETMDEYTSHSFRVERVLAAGTEHKEITGPADSSFTILLKTGRIGEFAPFNLQYAKNKGSHKATYKLTDQNSFTGISFYRITEIGQDTSKVYSKIVAVIGKPLKETLAVFPNPAVNRTSITVFSKTATSSKLQVFNNQGMVLKELPVSIVEGNNILSLPVTDLPAGTYFVRVIRAQNSLPLQAQFVKM